MLEEAEKKRTGVTGGLPPPPPLLEGVEMTLAISIDFFSDGDWR